MSQTKEKVQNYLQTDRSLSGGVVLYQSLPGRNMALAAGFARLHDTEANRNQVHYELCKLAGIPAGQMNSLLAERIDAKKENVDTQETGKVLELVGQGKVGTGVDESDEDTAEKDRFDSMKWNDIRKEAGALPEEFAPAGKSKADLVGALRAYDSHLAAQKKKAEKPQEQE
ncbi:hypothetical protein Oweho_3208 [Owenweeksia hongkongensis DSM 17368]|uniref:Uncharacterized protein n=1 Tax=Owenweeksia hongkongensis (strain DSM 17368 / CIP 108786 / JCM 12287 / NRRL B-23963 / UST20020801) TaxID=926562 RepID=G8R3S2_OWEHD|nr:hypothetical protein [Owenweeksia hongkongensis]AEV34159.1 hypothetical protein Oweho_3208 [Owenweeksia hongkongensis DSM 17368]